MIVAFTKDWDDVPTCTTHILREMAKTMPVLWVSSIGTRKPSAASGKDLRRIVGRIAAGLKRAEWKENQLCVLKPILIPKAESRMTKWINRKVFAWYVRRELRSVDSGQWTVEGEMRDAGYGMRDAERETCNAQRATSNEKRATTEYWCFVPNAVDLLPEEKTTDHRPQTADLSQEFEAETDKSASGSEPGPRIVYYCADDWGQFHNLDGAWMNAKEQELVARADAVFVTSRFLEDKLGGDYIQHPTSNIQRPTSNNQKKLRTRSSEPRTPIHYMPHGVEYERFSQALDKSGHVPEEMAGLSKPVVGFFGNLHPWVDFEILETLARARPEWSFVLIGEKYADVSRLEALPNVYLLGRREHACLHDYCRAFDAAIIPYDMSNPRMESVNPVKTKELLAAGLPVVASDVPELRNYGADVLTCTGEEAWLKALDRQVARTDHAEISERVRDQSWENKVAQIRAIIEG